jgi:hypothetical protein
MLFYPKIYRIVFQPCQHLPAVLCALSSAWMINAG